jgi:hypothetical protein
MPLVKIHVLEGQYDERRRSNVSKAVQDALMSVLKIPPTTSSRSSMSFPATASCTRRHLSE